MLLIADCCITGTIAAKMKRIHTQEVKSRSRAMTRAFNSYEPFTNLIGTRQKIWITEVAHDKCNLVGHTKNYVQVIVSPKVCCVVVDDDDDVVVVVVADV